jgi:flagellar biosynthesis regulator FlaF
MYQFAYSEICEELPSQNVPKTRRLSDAIEMIEAVQASPSRSHEWLGVLSDFRKLWLMIVEEDLPAGNHDEADVQPQILRLADGVLREIERCRFHKPENLAYAWSGMWPQ